MCMQKMDTKIKYEICLLELIPAAFTTRDLIIRHASEVTCTARSTNEFTYDVVQFNEVIYSCFAIHKMLISSIRIIYRPFLCKNTRDDKTSCSKWIAYSVM